MSGFENGRFVENEKEVIKDFSWATGLNKPKLIDELEGKYSFVIIEKKLPSCDSLKLLPQPRFPGTCVWRAPRRELSLSFSGEAISNRWDALSVPTVSCSRHRCSHGEDKNSALVGRDGFCRVQY